MTHPLAEIRTFPSLVKYLRDDLDWPIDTDDFEDLTFDFHAEELGIDPKSAAKIKPPIKQLRPLTSNQPWGIFFVNFEPKRLPVVALRKMLGSLVLKRRASANRAERAAWSLHDLLFISAFGEGDERQMTLAHFSESAARDEIPTLKVLGWDGLDTHLKLQHVDQELHHKLKWPDEGEPLDRWRARWSSAFTLRHRHVIKTAQELAEQLADLAKAIRQRANQVLSIESDRGPLKKLYAAFQEALIHDLSEDDFADMYAQTITYGLFSAAVSRTTPDMGTAVRADNLADMVPVTNPFLKEMLETFLTAGGRKGKLDFDELGIADVVEVLNSPDTHLEEVVRDFGNRGKGEDPVIHFYEDFLREYDKKRKVQRGVFYTPQPVVSYIVRSVHELLKTEFGLEDGLASTITWGEFVSQARRASEGQGGQEPGAGSQRSEVGGQNSANPKSEIPNPKSEIQIPAGTSPDSPFVTILDPATGTATFLVEVIDLIHKTMVAKWSAQGLSKQQKLDAWNEYVPRHLLPRLFGYELMMAPYAIAHMKIGLKLAETGYKFGSSERARIYLTNALEPPREEQQKTLQDWFPALAHEAAAVNRVKRDQRFTVVIGNPPYSKISSNLTPEMRALVERYRYADGKRIKEKGALQFEINLQDDYVKFFRHCEQQIAESSVGVLGVITNNGYLSTPTLRGMRESLLETHRRVWVFDLHGHLAKGEQGPDGAQEENVFDILQGVSLFLGSRLTAGEGLAEVFHAEIFGSRANKYLFLQANSLDSTRYSHIQPARPFLLLVPHDANLAQEWRNYVGLTELFTENSAGIVTARDGLVISNRKRELADRLERFSTAKEKDESIYEEFGFSASKRFDLRAAQSKLRRLESFTDPIRPILHRPFDERFIFFHPSVVWSMSRPMAAQMLGGKNLALVATRQVTRPQFEHAFVTRHIIEIKACSHDRNTQIFPLFVRDDGELELSPGDSPNIDLAVLSKVATDLGLSLDDESRKPGRDDQLTALQFFHYVYSVLYSATYRERYFEFLRSDFPRIPLPGSLDLFRALAKLGGELVALHLMESPKLDKHKTTFVGPAGPEVEKVSWANNTVWIDKKQTRGFRGVPKNVWNFHIGGYQVCEKWLKDRKGRTLSKDDLDHYHRIVVALSETIRLMAEIDQVIDQHGGWPGAFATGQSAASADPQESLPFA